MSDSRRVYSEAEFALILRKAAELASPTVTGHPAGGLTLAEMKSAASEAGIDPALVERAARLLPGSTSASMFERVIGGPLRHESGIHVPVKLDDSMADRLLSMVQISAGQPGSGHSSAMGMVWHAKDDLESLRVTAEPEGGGTAIAAHLDRRGTLVVVIMPTLLGIMATTLLGVGVGSEVGGAAGAVAGIAGISGVLAVARHFWASSTKRVRERINRVIDTVSQVVDKSDTSPLQRPTTNQTLT